jgi:hypothetical protein
LRPGALAGIAIGCGLGGCGIVLCVSGLHAEWKSQRQLRDAARQSREQYYVVTVMDEPLV